jgi:hypothetical protein
MHILLQRLTTSDNGTFGALIVNNKPCFVTLELPWKNNKSSISCIPPGTYHATKMYSSKFLKDVFVLHDVPGRDMIEFHIGNTIIDTHGCVLLGMEYSLTENAIVVSRSAFNEFMSMMPSEGFTVSVLDVAVKEGTSWI